MKPGKERCELCKYYFYSEYQCRYNPPGMLVKHGKTGVLVRAWPTVQKWDWCGRFKRK